MVNSKGKPSKTVEAILQLGRDTMEAIKYKDVDALDRIVADDFIHRSPGGGDAGKAEFLKSVASLPVKVVEIWGEELKVSVYGETAVLTGVQRVKTKSTDGEEETWTGAFADVFVRLDGRWRMVLAYSVDLPVIPKH